MRSEYMQYNISMLLNDHYQHSSSCDARAAFAILTAKTWSRDVTAHAPTLAPVYSSQVPTEYLNYEWDPRLVYA